METIEQIQQDKKEIALEKMRAELEGKRGQQYWRTLEEVMQTKEFEAWFEDEFPNRKEIFEIDRRSLLKYAGAGLALAGLTGCRGVFLPEEKLVPYVKAPEEYVSGKPLFYASAVTLAGYATGVLVEQYEGRPIKLEGNPDHPASGGALDSISQAEILNFYDPDRSQNVMTGGDISTWESFNKTASAKVAEGGVGILVGALTSPTAARLLARLQSKGAKLYSHEPSGRGNVIKAVAAVTGKAGVPVYDFSKAKVVVSLDGDFLSTTDNPGALVYSRQFAKARRVLGNKGEMSRLYAFEAAPGTVGAMADHRYAVKPSEVYGAGCALANALGIAEPAGIAPSNVAADLGAIAADLQKNRSASIVVAGEHQPAEVHQLAFQLNQFLGNVGQTVKFVEAPEFTSGYGTVAELLADIKVAKIKTLIISNTNPVYASPADMKVGETLAAATSVAKIHHGLYFDETAEVCDWHIPMTHSLEAWGDARSYEGTAGVVQPLIAPLYDGRSDIEVFSGLLGEPKGGYDLVRETLQAKGFGGAAFEKSWREAIHNGTIPNSASATLAMAGGAAPLPAPVKSAGMEVGFAPDPTIFDGRFANNGWLQETPKPLSKLVWDNVVYMSPTDAQASKISVDDVVLVKTSAGEIEGTVFILPGHAVGSITIHLGYGRTAGGTLATLSGVDGGGFSAYKLMSSKNTSYSSVTITPTGKTQHLSTTQGHSPLGGDKIPDHRDVIREATLEKFNAAEDKRHALMVGHSMEIEEIKENNLMPEEVFAWNGEKWGMTIDMNACTGCGACITACQAENNISVVGKEQVSRGREMHWIRIDRYYSGSDENPSVTWQPVACVHCETAPCEPVCPVAATVHSHEGINQMVYNRCVGTRYCSNNCPYKVRRFNYLNWTDNQAQFSEKNKTISTRRIPGAINTPKDNGLQLLKMLNNPDVSVRGRGVMEKCTYCTQRISEARIEAKKAGRQIAEGDIVTACQQACPSEAIVFGNIADKNSQVAKLRNDPRSYLLLEELQTRPRTSHLAKLRNPNPEIKSAKAEEAHH
ncbi:MAG: TAT-variant-translocated molybdopterin oxidoreductase [Armatimonadota bacterium]